MKYFIMNRIIHTEEVKKDAVFDLIQITDEKN